LVVARMSSCILGRPLAKEATRFHLLLRAENNILLALGHCSAWPQVSKGKGIFSSFFQGIAA